MKISDSKIGTRLAAGFGLLLILMVLLTAAGSWVLHDMSASVDTILHDAVAKERVATEWHDAVELDTARTSLMLASDDPAVLHDATAKMQATSERISQTQKELERKVASVTGKGMLADANEKRQRYSELRQSLLAAKTAGDTAAVQAGMAGLNAARDAYIDAVGKLGAHQRKKAETLGAAIAGESQSGQLLLAGLCTVALALALACTVLVTRSITRPLQRAMAVACEVSEGRLSNHTETCSRDETGQLLAALYNRMENWKVASFPDLIMCN